MKSLLSLTAGLSAALLAAPAGAQSFTTVGNGGRAVDWAQGQTNILIDDGTPYVWVTSTSTAIVLDPGGDFPVAIADSGQVLGNAPDTSGPDTSALWLPGSWTPLGGISASGCPDLSSPYDLSDDGMVATGLGWEGCSGRAYKWTPGTGMVALPQDGPNSARGNAVSGDGSTVGGWDEHSTGQRRAAIWYPGDVEVLPLVSGSDPVGAGEVWGFSADGTWACGDGNAAGPFLYSQATGPIFLGFPGPLGPFDVSVAYGVSDDGKVVVGTQGSFFGTPPRAWIWTATDGIQWLSDYLTGLGITLPAGASLSDATALSADGTKILGTYDAGAFTPQNAFIAEIPAQASWSTYGAGASPANVLTLDGGGSASTGGTFMPTTTGIPFLATFSATGVSLSDANLPLLGGTALIHPAQLVQTVLGAPAGTGTVTDSFPIPAQPALFGLTVFLQSLCDDPSQPQGFAFSNGLSLTICL